MSARASHRSRRARGMSLIEIIIVMVILGLVAVAVGPEITQQLRNLQIRNAAEAMQAGLQKARSEAISRNANVRFTLVSGLASSCTASATGGSWIVSLDDPAGKCNQSASATVAPRIIAVQSGSDGGAMAAIAATRSDLTSAQSTIVFNGFGRPVDTNQLARIVVSSAVAPADYRSYQLDVSTIGSVRMCDPKVSPSSDDPRRCPPP
jgi:type IV fimbrial biogenesis protein FimT